MTIEDVLKDLEAKIVALPDDPDEMCLAALSLEASQLMKDIENAVQSGT